MEGRRRTGQSPSHAQGPWENWQDSLSISNPSFTPQRFRRELRFRGKIKEVILLADHLGKLKVIPTVPVWVAESLINIATPSMSLSAPNSSQVMAQTLAQSNCQGSVFEYFFCPFLYLLSFWDCDFVCGGMLMISHRSLVCLTFHHFSLSAPWSG